MFCKSFQGDFPVVRENRVVGIVTKDMLLEALHQRSAEVHIEDIMLQDFRTASQKTGLAELLSIMQEHNQTAIPIIDDGKLTGLITLEQIGKYSMFCATKKM